MAGSNKVFAPSSSCLTASANQNARTQTPFGKSLADTRIPLATLLTHQLEATLFTAQGRINRHPLPDMESAHLLSQGSYLTKQLVPRNNRQTEIRLKRRRLLPLQEAEITPTNPRDFAFDDDPVFAREIRSRDICKTEMS